MNKKNKKQKILLVEDDVNLGFLLVEYFESNGFDVKLYIDGKAGLKGFQLDSFDICIVDIMLPKLDGFSLVKEMNLPGQRDEDPGLRNTYYHSFSKVNERRQNQRL